MAALGLCAGIGSPGPAIAAEADRASALRWFDGVDTDRSGTIDLAEVDRVREKRVRRYDGDGDGYISLDEFNYSVPRELEDELERRRRRFAVMDLDGDERLDRSEYMGFGARVVDAADLDGDGAVTRDEFLQTVAPD